jgi:hypothetical protein
MDAIQLETAAFLLMALSLPLISVGSTGSGSLWIVGFAVLVIGTMIPPILRYMDTPQATA